MENIKKISFQDCNLIVYCKLSGSNKYEPVQSLHNLTIAANLMYAALYPFESLEKLKMWLDTLKEPCLKYGVSFQIRSSKGRKKIYYQV